MLPLIIFLGAIILTDATTVFPSTTSTTTTSTTTTTAFPFTTTTTNATTENFAYAPVSPPPAVNATITPPANPTPPLNPLVIGLRAKIVSTVPLDINAANSILQQYVSYLQPSQGITARVTSIKML